MEKKKEIFEDIDLSNAFDNTKKKEKGKAAPGRRKKQKTFRKHKTKGKQPLKEKPDTNVFRWAIGALCSAVCEHRWDDAFRLLPCVIIRMVREVPHHFLWRMTDIITRNATGISLSLRKQLRRDICELNVKAHEVVLDSLSQDLQKADDFETDNLLQMIDDFSRKRSSNTRFLKGTQKRLKYLLDGYIGQVLYYRWKNCQCQKEETHLAEVQDNTVSSSQTAEIDWPIMHEIFGSHELTAGDKWQELPKQAYTAMKKALSNLGEPCEWLMERYLDLERELYGTEAAVSTLKLYLKKNPDHLPAHRLSYHFYKKNIPDSNENQVEALKEIARMCPDDPLVLEYVDALLRYVEHNELPEVPKRIKNIGMDYDSGMEECEDTDNKLTIDDDEIYPSCNQKKQSCLLKSSGNVQTLKTCLNLMTALLEYKEFVWDLQPWQRLTRILRKFYLAWINCWSCLLCKQSRELVNKVAERVTPLWQYYVWTPVPEKFSLEKANVLIHHIFSAHMFSYSLVYLTKAKAALHSNGYQTVADELKNILALPGPFVEKFNAYSRHRRLRFEHLEVETFGTHEHYKEKDVELSKRLSLQAEKYEQNCIEDNDSLEHIKNKYEENEHVETQNETDLSSLNDERELHCNSNFKVGSILKRTVETQSSQSIVDISQENCDISFDEHDMLLTSTQVKDENLASLERACLAEDPVHNGSFIGCLQTSPKMHVDYSASLCMVDSRKHVEPCQKQKERLLTSELQNAEINIMEDRQDETSLREEVTTKNTSSIEIDLPHQQKSEVLAASNVLDYDPKDTQRLSFETENFSSVVDDNQKRSELCSSVKPQEDKNSEDDRTVPTDKKSKRRLHRKERKAKTLISHCPTSPNQEEQNRDLDMNVEEDNYDPQSKYTFRFNDSLESHPKASISLDIDHNAANQTNHDSVNPKTSVATYEMLREEPENSLNLEQNHKRFLSPGISSKEPGNSLPCGQRQCSSTWNIAENSQEHGNSPSDNIGMSGNDSFYLPLHKNSDLSAFVPHSHKSFVTYNTVVDETLTQLSIKYVDDGIHIIPETQSQVTKDQRNPLSVETLVGGMSKVAIPCNQKAYDEGNRNLKNKETMHSKSEYEIGDTQMEDDISSTQESKSSSRFFLTPGQRVSLHDTQDAQELYSSMNLISKTDIVGFCKTEEEAYEDDESIYVENCQTRNLVDRHHAISASAFVASGHQPNDLQCHLLHTPPGQLPNMYSNGDTDEMNSGKGALRKNICSIDSSTLLVNKVLKEEESDSENCIGPTQDDVSSMPKKHLVHHSMPCDSLSHGSIRPKSDNEMDPKITSDDLYLPFLENHESYQSPSLPSPQTSVSEGDQVDKENVLEVTPLSAMHLTDKELELLSQPTNGSDTDCQEVSMSLLAFTSEKLVIKTKDIFPQTRTEGPDKAMNKSLIEHLPYRSDESASFHQANVHKTVKDDASDKTSMDNYFNHNETEGKLCNTLIINSDQEGVNSIWFEDETGENNNHYENIFDSVYITTSDVKSEFEHEYIEKDNLTVNTKQNEKQCCKHETVEEAQSKKSTQKKEGVGKGKTDFSENSTNFINQDDWMMRKYKKCSRNDEKTHYFPDKIDRTYTDNYCEHEGNLEHKSIEESSTLNEVHKAVPCGKDNTIPVEAETKKNAKKKKKSGKARTVKSIDEQTNCVKEVCRETQHQMHSRNKVSKENNTKNHKENDSWYDYIDDLPFPVLDYAEESGGLYMFDNSLKVNEKQNEVDGFFDGSVCDVTETRTQKSHPKYQKKKTNYVLSWFEGLPLPGLDVLVDDMVNLANRNSPEKSKNSSELLENKTLEGSLVENEHMKSPQFTVSLDNKTDVECSVKDRKNEHLVESLMLREKFMQTEKDKENGAKENNNGSDFVENDKIINEQVTTTRKRKQKPHQLADEVAMIKYNDYEQLESGLMSEKKEVQERKGRTKLANKVCQSTKVENEPKKKRIKPLTKKKDYMLQSHSKVCDVANSCNTDLKDHSFVLEKRTKKRKVDNSEENINKLINIKSSDTARVSLSKAKLSKRKQKHLGNKTEFLCQEDEETLEINLLPEDKFKKQESIVEESKEINGHLILAKEPCKSINLQETHDKILRKKRRLNSKKNYEYWSNAVINNVVSEEIMKARNSSDAEKQKVSGIETELPLSDVKVDTIDNYLNSKNVSLPLCTIRIKKKKGPTNIKSYGSVDVQETGSKLKKKNRKRQLTDSESYLDMPDIDKVVLNECTINGVDDRVISERKTKRGKNYSNEGKKQNIGGNSFINITEGKTVCKYKKEIQRKSLQKKLLNKSIDSIGDTVESKIRELDMNEKQNSDNITELAKPDVGEADIDDICKKNDIGSNLISEKTGRKKTRMGYAKEIEDCSYFQIQNGSCGVGDKQVSSFSVAMCKNDLSDYKNRSVQLENNGQNDSFNMNTSFKERKNTVLPYQQSIDNAYSDETIDCSGNSITNSTRGKNILKYKKEMQRKSLQKKLSKSCDNSVSNIFELSQGKSISILSSLVQSPSEKKFEVQQLESSNCHGYNSGVSPGHCRGSIIKRNVIADIIQKENITKKLSLKHLRLKENQSQPSPPRQKCSKHTGKFHCLF